MKKIKIFFSILLIALVLCGCSQKLTQGEVIEKKFTPAHSEVMIIPMVTTDGKNTSITNVLYIYYYSDTYKITIRDYIDNEEQTATYRVTQEVYDSVDVGNEFIYSEEYEPDEPEYTREEQEDIEK